ncbi:hypothetical protein [Labilibaculum euxinus]
MGLFKKQIPLLEIDYLIWNEVENVKINFSHPELKPIEFVYLAIYQFAKVVYTVPNLSNDLELTISRLANLDTDDIISDLDDLLGRIRGINTDLAPECSMFKTKLSFKSLIERSIKTKIPFRLSQNKFLRTIPLSIKLAYENSSDLEKEILKVAIPYQANLYLNGTDFRKMRNLLDIPIASFQYGLDNRKLDI